MTKAARPLPALPPISLVAIAVVIVLICFVVPIFPFRVAGQAFLLVMLLRAFCYWPPMAHWAGSMPWPHRLVLLLLLGGMVAGHFTLTTHKYFPFVAWEIFPFERNDDPVTCREFLATTASGKSVRLLVEQVFPSIVQFNPPADNDSDAMTHLVHALARVYNRHHAADPVRQVDLVRMAVRLHPSANGAPFSCESLKHYAISSGPSS